MTCAHALTLSLLTRICQSYIYTAYTRISSREITEYTVMYGVYMWLWPTLLLIPNSKFCVLQLRDMYSCSDTHSSHVLMLRHSLLTCTHAPTLTPHMYSLLTCTHAPTLLTCTHAPTLTPHMCSCFDTHSSPPSCTKHAPGSACSNSWGGLRWTRCNFNGKQTQATPTRSWCVGGFDVAWHQLPRVPCGTCAVPCGTCAEVPCGTCAVPCGMCAVPCGTCAVVPCGTCEVPWWHVCSPLWHV